MAKTNVRFFLKNPPIFYYLLPPHSCHSTHLGLGAIVLFTSESSNAQLGPNQGQTWPIAKWGLSCQNTRRVNEDWRLNWRDMNIAQKLWDSTVGSHSWTGSTPHPLNSNPGTNIVPPSTASQNCHLRLQAHSQQLPQHTGHMTDSNFITRMFFTDIY